MQCSRVCRRRFRREAHATLPPPCAGIGYKEKKSVRFGRAIGPDFQGRWQGLHRPPCAATVLVIRSQGQFRISPGQKSLEIRVRGFDRWGDTSVKTYAAGVEPALSEGMQIGLSHS